MLLLVNFNFIGIFWWALVCLLVTYNLSNLLFTIFTVSLKLLFACLHVQLQNNKMWEWIRFISGIDILSIVMGVLAIFLCLFPLHPWEKEERRCNGQFVIG